MQSHINSSVFTDDTHYFLTFLTDRFAPLNLRWQKALEKRFRQKFEPINVLQHTRNSLVADKNYLVVNEVQEKLQKKTNRADLIFFDYCEEINKQFCQSPQGRDLVRKLTIKQGGLFVVSFSSVWLEFDSPKVIILGPNPKIAERFDNKLEHFDIFNELGLPTLEFSKFDNIDQLKKVNLDFPYYITATYSSAGVESGVINNTEELMAYHNNLRTTNKRGGFLVSEYVSDIASTPNTTALVHGENKTTMINISDQILHGNSHFGNIYPSIEVDEIQKSISDMTVLIGNYMSKQGFRGLFGCDFLLTKSGQCTPIDLNPRRQGGYFCLAMMSTKHDLMEIELLTSLGEKLPEISYPDFQANYSWVQTKLNPPHPYIKITSELLRGSPAAPFQSIGESFAAQFYPKDHIMTLGNPGYYVQSAKSRQELERNYEQTIDGLRTSLYQEIPKQEAELLQKSYELVTQALP